MCMCVREREGTREIGGGKNVAGQAEPRRVERIGDPREGATRVEGSEGTARTAGGSFKRLRRAIKSAITRENNIHGIYRRRGASHFRGDRPLSLLPGPAQVGSILFRPHNFCYR